MSEQIFKTMDTVAQVVVEGAEEKLALSEAVAVILDYEKRFNCHVPESDISKLCKNIKVGERYTISTDLYEVLEIAKKINKQTNGLFDIDFLNKDTVKEYVLMPPQTIIFNSKKTRLNLGAIGKGFAADKVLEIIKKYKVDRAMISMGGQITGFSNKKPWRLGLQNPDKEYGEILATLEVTEGSLSTSNEKYRGKHIKATAGNKRDKNIKSVSVFNKSGTLADGFSTALFLSDKSTLKNIIKISNLDVIIVKENQIEVSGNLVESLSLVDKSYKINNLNLKG